MKELWREALSKGVCPFGGCEIKTQICMHLNKYLSYSPKTYTDKSTGGVKKSKSNPEVSLLYTEDIDDFSLRSETKLKHPGIWDVFKKIRKYGLDRDQIGILVRKFGVGMTDRQILDEMHWTSFNHMYRRYRAALATLKKRGFGESK